MADLSIDFLLKQAQESGAGMAHKATLLSKAIESIEADLQSTKGKFEVVVKHGGIELGLHRTGNGWRIIVGDEVGHGLLTQASVERKIRAVPALPLLIMKLQEVQLKRNAELAGALETLGIRLEKEGQ